MVRTITKTGLASDPGSRLSSCHMTCSIHMYIVSKFLRCRKKALFGQTTGLTSQMQSILTIYIFILTQHVCRGCMYTGAFPMKYTLNLQHHQRAPNQYFLCMKKVGAPQPWTAPAPPRSERGRRGRPGPLWRRFASTQPSACRLERQD
jgi:hypothetical protein